MKHLSVADNDRYQDTKRSRFIFGLPPKENNLLWGHVNCPDSIFCDAFNAGLIGL